MGERRTARHALPEDVPRERRQVMGLAPQFEWIGEHPEAHDRFRHNSDRFPLRNNEYSNHGPAVMGY